ncbi:serine carboxypeptidase-like 48 [Tripterygium wilfordii]|uniref:serine carboxypeptidase-like 48 n=1 Tax=Tripterygium wilfordii TaxID=458696 RepID=UPI0018F82FD3|nr:serine carboxypeptidase-like 48 [Tripterygium wilfordii]
MTWANDITSPRPRRVHRPMAWYYDIRKRAEGDSNYNYSRINNFLNNQMVKDALRVSDRPFSLSSSIVYEAMKGDIMRNYDVKISALLDDGIKVLIYVGDYYLLCNHLENSEWVLNMKWYAKEEFGKAPSLPYFVDNEEVGLLRSYGPLSFLRVYNAGHMVSMDQQKVALHMIRNWMQGELN